MKKNDVFSNKMFFKTYDNIYRDTSSRSPTKKLSPKNERVENNKKTIKVN